MKTARERRRRYRDRETEQERYRVQEIWFLEMTHSHYAQKPVPALLILFRISFDVFSLSQAFCTVLVFPPECQDVREMLFFYTSKKAKWPLREREVKSTELQ